MSNITTPPDKGQSKIKLPAKSFATEPPIVLDGDGNEICKARDDGAAYDIAQALNDVGRAGYLPPTRKEADSGQKHTPGPWAVVKCRRMEWAIKCSRELLNDDRRTEIVAEIKDPVGYMPAHENAANAALIAAAPDLLAALKAAACHMRTMANQFDDGRKVAGLGFAAQAEAAIATAEVAMAKISLGGGGSDA